MLTQTNMLITLKADNKLVSGELLQTADDISIPIEYNKEEKNHKLLTATLYEAKNNQKDTIKCYEEDDKRYALLQRYGYILEKVQKLLDEISFDFTYLSLTELSEQLEKLAKTRKINTTEISYDFYQDLFTSTTESLITLEEDFENGKISSAEALAQIRFLKNDFNSNIEDMPAQFKSSKQDISLLLNMYEDAFSQEKANVTANNTNTNHDLNKQTKIDFDALNEKTKEINLSTKNLFLKLSKFEPVVSLEPLCKQLKTADEFFKVDNFGVDQAGGIVSELDSNVTKLYDEQKLKNNTKYDYSIEITALVDKTKNLDTQTRNQISIRAQQSANERISKILSKLPKISELLEGNTSIPENLATQICYCCDNVIAKDDSLCMEIAASTSKNTHLYDEELASLTLDELYELKNRIKELSMLRSPQLHPTPDSDESNK